MQSELGRLGVEPAVLNGAHKTRIIIGEPDVDFLCEECIHGLVDSCHQTGLLQIRCKHLECHLRVAADGCPTGSAVILQEKLKGRVLICLLRMLGQRLQRLRNRPSRAGGLSLGCLKTRFICWRSARHRWH